MNLFLETKRLILRPHKETDIEDMVEGLNNIEIAKNLAKLPFPYTKQDAEEYVSSRHEEWKKIPIEDYVFVIELKEEKKVIGAIGIHNINTSKKNAETGSWIAQPYWKNGYITEAKIAINDFSFSVLGLEELLSPVYVDNVASNAAQQRLGYELKEVRKDAQVCLATGVMHDENFYVLTKEKWRNHRELVVFDLSKKGK